MSAAEHVYRYAAPSRREGGTLALRTSGSAAVDAEQPFLECLLLQPRAMADWLLTVAAIGGRRFVAPTTRLAPPSVLPDPVVTVARDRVCFESLSSCGSVHARLDCDVDAIAPERGGFGSASVDFGEPLRTALAALRDGERARMQIGAVATEKAPAGSAVIERRVELSARWLCAFAAAPAVMAGVDRCAELGGPEMLTLLRSLSRTRASGWFVPNGRTMRLMTTPSASGVRIGGAERLVLLEPALEHATTVLLFGRYGVSASPFGVVLRRPGLQLTVMSSTESRRSFVDEDESWPDLARPLTAVGRDRVRASLSGHDACDAAVDADGAAALAQVALAGSVAYSLIEQRWFRRELPLPRALLAESQARFVAANELVGAGAVRWLRGVAEVDGGEAMYRVRRDPDGGWTCTCPVAKGRDEQGPCAHNIAAALTEPKPGA